jgi:hypothetical protein
MLRILFFLFFLLCTCVPAQAQLPDSCKLAMGTNLAGLADYGTELPFVDLMRNSREWYTKSVGDPADPFNSGFADSLNLRPDGYPTHVPQTVNGSQFPQHVATIWGKTDGWPLGEYTILWDGDGELSFFGTYENLELTGDRRATFNLVNRIDGVVEIKIVRSDVDKPIHNIRLLMPGAEATYLEQPFNPLWLEKVDVFETVRFMDWGSTNGWGTKAGETGDGTLTDWAGRSQPNYYTWTHSKGIPYEMMVRFMNDNDKDGWVCVPHTASEDYVREMARFFRDNLEEERHIYVEYSNEIWNWIFPQTHWANLYGCEIPGRTWPEGTTTFIQNMLDVWTEEYAAVPERTSRVVGVQAGWLDVAQRVAFNVDSASYDYVSPTYYFGFTEEAEEELDGLGANATVADIARLARTSMPNSFSYLADIKTEVADVIDKPLAFYEGGQHLTPNPFGVVPTYENALVDIQRDTSMYNLYNEWFDLVRTLQDGDEPLALMNFSFVAPRSPQFGSWGLLETMDQDTSLIPAPKYKAVLENMAGSCSPISSIWEPGYRVQDLQVYPNPSAGIARLIGINGPFSWQLFNAAGSLVRSVDGQTDLSLKLMDLPDGSYFLLVREVNGGQLHRGHLVLMK